MGFLDNAGLAHFTAWVKERLAGKQNTITAGDGISKTGDTLGVTTPVRGVVTQAEFDALTEAQQSKGLYVISDGADGLGSNGSSTGEVYSTEETRIGTWIDGKPLYRRVLQFQSPGNSNTPVVVYSDFTIANYTPVHLYGIIFATNSTLPLNCAITESVGLYVHNSNGIMMNIKHATYQSKPVTLIAEYTKTTEEGVTT